MNSNLNLKMWKKACHTLCKISIITTMTVLIAVYICASCLGLYALWDTDTEYAPNYSRSNFNAVTVNMTSDKVKMLIGEPFFISTLDDGGEIWIYSRQGKDQTANYFARLVYFTKDKVVKRKEASIYVD